MDADLDFLLVEDLINSFARENIPKIEININ